MKTETIVMCVVALLLGMLLANMLKNVCGCKTVEGQHKRFDFSTHRAQLPPPGAASRFETEIAMNAPLSELRENASRDQH